MSICSRIVGRTAEVDTVPRDESPVSLEGERFELPVFSARLAHLCDMRTVRETGVDGNFYKIRTQALIDQKTSWRGVSHLFAADQSFTRQVRGR
jgi:hypothetical protein